MVAAPSSFSVLTPIASALVSDSDPAVLISSVPVVPEKAADVAALAASSNSLSLAPLPIARARVPLTPLFTSSVPPVAVTVPDPASVAATVPKPVSVAPPPIVRPDESVSVPPSSLILPLVMLSPPVMVRLPAAPTSSV